MRAVVQRVHSAECVVDGKVVSKIDKGLVAYIGVFDDDTDEDLAKMANKISGLRVFVDEAGKLSLNASAVGGSVMLISNFVLAGRVTRGFRPDCTHAARYDEGKRMFDALACEILEHSGHYLAGGAHVFCDLLMGEFDGVGVILRHFIVEEDGETAVHTHKENLFKDPHYLREIGDRVFEGEDFRLGNSLGNLGKGAATDDDKIGVLLGIDDNVEGDVMERTGGTQNTDVSRKEAIECDFAPLLGEHVNAQGTRLYN